MRDATKEEMEQYNKDTQGWKILISYLTKEGKRKKKTFGPFFTGVEVAKQKALEKIKETHKDASDFIIDEPDEGDYEWNTHPDYIFEDYKSIRYETLLKIDKMCYPSQEVVLYSKNIDMYIFNLGPRITVEENITKFDGGIEKGSFGHFVE